MTRTPAEVAAEAHYEAYFGSLIPSVEHPWPRVPADHKDRMLTAMSAALSALEREGYVLVHGGDLWSDESGNIHASQSNLREAWSALALIRETVETLGPVGAMQASEHLAGPTFTDEAEAIVEGVRKMVPAGCVVVPVESTPEMLHAMWDCLPGDAQVKVGRIHNHPGTAALYRAMLSARPQDGGGV